uniref:Uncharacterized protein n=1 Tax=Anopheles maculatus TaxID=74869 RepID=A0A182T9C9_9DIPT
MALTDGRRPTKESHAWTVWPWSTARDTARVTPGPAGSSSGIVSSTATTTTSTSYTASPPTVSFPAAFHPSGTSSRTPFSSTGPPSVRSRTRLTTVVDQLSSLVSSTVTDTDDGTDADLSTPVSSSYGAGGNPTSTSFPTTDTGSVRNLTQSLLSNYTTTDYGGDSSNGSSYSSSPSAMSIGDRGSTIPGGLSLSLPDLLEEDELMALWNCTNCFLLNYGAVGGVNSTGKYYGNGTVDPRDVLLPTDDDDALASETTIYLIRVIATAIVLGIVILATVIGK